MHRITSIVSSCLRYESTNKEWKTPQTICGGNGGQGAWLFLNLRPHHKIAIQFSKVSPLTFSTFRCQWHKHNTYTHDNSNMLTLWLLFYTEALIWSVATYITDFTSACRKRLHHVWASTLMIIIAIISVITYNYFLSCCTNFFGITLLLQLRNSTYL